MSASHDLTVGRINKMIPQSKEAKIKPSKKEKLSMGGKKKRMKFISKINLRKEFDHTMGKKIIFLLP